ncbi:NAD(P)-dependent dehydrogenase (short-subunit alcohol dehydrogenase family) [Arthrobacter ginsengisoli]|uniref:NAD(P)-dependent dehydrogenase (Short-subunit alcohol dehydrogenase family) n=1 Tax=Arthrobacter ginsengisoli TaxID=1356565 RepID=A0ABU1UGF4_9MICC|nr:NAD(P)-dependent dehydrogenase (short-subunit alcohol dehydrogenase family) [Arthrobacter ginsengisoli]
MDLDPDAAANIVNSITEAGGHAVALAGDVTDPGLSTAAVDLAQRAFGRIDILVNNAGMGSPTLSSLSRLHATARQTGPRFPEQPISGTIIDQR